MNIAVDLGNSFAKYGKFERNQLLEKSQKVDIDQLVAKINQEQPSHVIFSSVNHSPEEIALGLDTSIDCLILDAKMEVPIKNDYQSKNTLGQDRLAAVIGANFLYPGERALIVDAGTCITYDYIDETGTYHGGAISPGFTMKLKAIHHFTAKLPLLSLVESTELVGTSTAKSILSGVINGTIAEIAEMIRMYERKFGDLRVIICGGDMELVKKNLSNNVTYVADLVLIGLNRILNYHVEGI